MLRVVCWLWSDPEYRFNHLFRYGPEHVNKLHNGLKRHLHIPFELCCITDLDGGFDDGIKIIPIWDDLRDMGGCWNRLKVFSAAMKKTIGPRFVSIDLDCVITGDVTPLFDRKDDFLIWKNVHRHTPYCGSMFMMKAGARREVWDHFNRDISLRQCRETGFVGTDQAWIGTALGPDEAVWTEADGVYSLARHIASAKELPDRARRKGTTIGLPDNARIVFFHGARDPSQPELQRKHPWIAQHWQ